jgi:hypothetical protein
MIVPRSAARARSIGGSTIGLAVGSIWSICAISTSAALSTGAAIISSGWCSIMRSVSAFENCRASSSVATRSGSPTRNAPTGILRMFIAVTAPPAPSGFSSAGAGAVGRASFPPQYRSLSICRDRGRRRSCPCRRSSLEANRPLSRCRIDRSGDRTSSAGRAFLASSTSCSDDV